MTTPAVSAYTRRLYDSLPEHYRDSDSDLGHPLLRYLSLLGDQAGSIEELLDRLVTDLTDPWRADPAWLPWLSQLVGARLPAGLTVEEQRATIAAGAGGFLTGTRDAIAEVARRALTGGRYVTVTSHLDGDPYRIGLNVAEEDTPSIAAVIAVVEAADAKPAGYELVVTFYRASWDTLEAAYPTSDAWDATGSWSAIENTRAA